MKHTKLTICAALTILSSMGCSAGGDHGGSKVAPLGESDVPAAESGDELARLEFDDGNVVRFEALKGGVLVTELGSDLNPRRIPQMAGLTALAAFERLAPGREVPERLLQMHESMYSAQSAAAERFDRASEPASLPFDPDLEHDGDFQQAYPASTFLNVMCDFPTGNGSYKHTNRTDAHMDASMDVHMAYFAVGSDLGTITAQPCAGENEGGFFDGECGSTIPVQAGYHNSGFYDAGPNQVCSGGSGFLECTLFGCFTVCYHPQVRFELRYGKVSTNVNFHECVQVTH